MKTQYINVWGQGFGPAAELPLGVLSAKQSDGPNRTVCPRLREP